MNAVGLFIEARFPMNAYVALLLSIISEVLGTSSLKASSGFSLLAPTMLVFAGYGLAFYFRSIAVRNIPLGVVYALWSGLGSMLIVCVGWLVFGQIIDATDLCGIALVVAGCIVLNVFSRTSSH